ncbi:hypothetical protein ACVFVO_05480 [Advenella kashmirensis]
MERALDYDCIGLWDMATACRFEQLQQVKLILANDAVVTKHASNSPIPIQIYSLFIINFQISTTVLAVLGQPYYCLWLRSKNSFMKRQMCNPNWLMRQFTAQENVPRRS